MTAAALIEAEPATIAQAQAGDLRAFEALYRVHAGSVFGLCLRLTGQREAAEDCLQETFVAAWQALHTFQGRSQLSTWLHRIAVNCVLAQRRRAGNALSGDHAAAASGLETDAGSGIDIERAIAGLPPGARDVLVLVGVYGYTHEEAGAMLGLAAGTCKAQLHRARALLCQRLDLDPEHL